MTKAGEPGPESERGGVPPGRGARAALVGVVLVLTACVLQVVVFSDLPLGVSGQWVWNRYPAPVWDRLLLAALPVFLVLAGLTVFGAAQMRAASRAARAATLGILVFLAFALQLAFGYAGEGGLYECLFNLTGPKASVYLRDAEAVHARKAGVGSWLAGYEEHIRRFSVQTSTHPPGPTLCMVALYGFYADRPALAERVSRAVEARLPTAGALGRLEALVLGLEGNWPRRATAWTAALLFKLLAAMLVVPVYLLAARRKGPAVGLQAAGLAAVVPSIVMFSPGFDQVYPTLAAALLLAVDAAVERNSWLLGVAAGTAGMLCMQLSLAFGAVILLCVICATLKAAGRGAGGEVAGRVPAFRRALRPALGAAGGFLAPVIACMAALGFNAFAVWVRCAAHNDRFHAAFGRTYWPWVWVNVVEFAVFLGVPVAALAAVAVGGLLRDAARRGRVAVCGGDLLVAALVTGGMLAVTGRTLGETARVWMFLAPFAVVAGAQAVGVLEGRRRWVFPCLLGLQFVQAAVMRVSMDVMSLYGGG
jgi:hypothetical protein